MVLQNNMCTTLNDRYEGAFDTLTLQIICNMYVRCTKCEVLL